MINHDKVENSPNSAHSPMEVVQDFFFFLQLTRILRCPSRPQDFLDSAQKSCGGCYCGWLNPQRGPLCLVGLRIFHYDHAAPPAKTEWRVRNNMAHDATVTFRPQDAGRVFYSRRRVFDFDKSQSQDYSGCKSRKNRCSLMSGSCGVLCGTQTCLYRGVRPNTGEKVAF